MIARERDGSNLEGGCRQKATENRQESATSGKVAGRLQGYKITEKAREINLLQGLYNLHNL